jgi:lactam utilization protein B
VELESVRWQLSIHNHRSLLKRQLDTAAAAADVQPAELLQQQLQTVEEEPAVTADGVTVRVVSAARTFFIHGDVLSAATFDPFTHVYMFDLG